MKFVKIASLLSKVSPRIRTLPQAGVEGTARLLVHTLAKRKNGNDSYTPPQPPGRGVQSESGNNRQNYRSAKPRPAPEVTSKPAAKAASNSNPSRLLANRLNSAGAGLSRDAQRAAAMAAASALGLGPVSASPPAMSREGEAALLLVQNMVALAKQLRLPVSYKVCVFVYVLGGGEVLLRGGEVAWLRGWWRGVVGSDCVER